MVELADEIHEQIEQLSTKADALADRERYQEAQKLYQQGIDLLPEPKHDWEAWTWLQSAIGEAYFFEKNYREAIDAFMQAQKGPDGVGNPFIHLRLGQCAYQLGDKKTATEELLRAYMGAGEEIFEEDELYYNYLKSQVNLDRPTP